MFIVVPTPTVSVDVPTTQTVGQSLTLQYNVTMVRGITSRVDIMWKRKDGVFNTTRVTATTTMSSLLVYRGSYIISQLSTSDDGVIYEYRLIVRQPARVKTNGTIKLNVTGKYFKYNLYQCLSCVVRHIVFCFSVYCAAIQKVCMFVFSTV